MSISEQLAMVNNLLINCNIAVNELRTFRCGAKILIIVVLQILQIFKIVLCYC